MTKHQKFSSRINKAIEEKGLKNVTQKELGKLFGVSGTMAWNYKNGEKLPSMETAINIAKSLDISLEWLMTGRGGMLLPLCDELNADLGNLNDHGRKQVQKYIRFLISDTET